MQFGLSAAPKIELKSLKYFFGQVGGWEEELKNKTNLSQSGGWGWSLGWAWQFLCSEIPHEMVPTNKLGNRL